MRHVVSRWQVSRVFLAAALGGACYGIVEAQIAAHDANSAVAQANVDRANNREKFQQQLDAAKAQIVKQHNDSCTFIAELPLGATPAATEWLHIVEKNASCPLTDAAPLPAVTQP